MPTALTSEHNLYFNRRGDPDPPVGIGENFSDHTLRYEYTWLQFGPIRIKMYQDRGRSQRTLQHLLDELQEKLNQFGKTPAANGFAYVQNPKVARKR